MLWRENGYFDNAADTKPLLHLWSLSIEEQFYIIWPLLLWAAWKRRLNLLTIIFVIAIISFALNINEIRNDVVATFYSPQTRFWELMTGSVLAWIALDKQNIFGKFKHKVDIWLWPIAYAQAPETNGDPLCNVQSVLGAALIAIGILLITKESHFPGWRALLPTLGAALIISAGAQAWLNRAVISNRVLGWFGLISYPLYLWHWPVLSFARIVEGETPAPEIRIAAIFISIALSWLTYRLLEKPIRSGTHGKAKTIALLVLMVVVGYAGYNTFQREGLLFRNIAKLTSDLSKAKTDYLYITTTFRDGKIENLYKLTGSVPESVLFFGDSMMTQYYPRAVKIYSNNGNVPHYSAVFASRNHCRPMPYTDLTSEPENIKCNDYYRAAIKLAKDPIYKKIVIAGFWPHAFSDNYVESNFQQFIADLALLKQSGKEIFLISMIPHSPKFNPTNLAHAFRLISLNSVVGISENVWLDRSQLEINDSSSFNYLSSIASKSGATLINPYDYFCPAGRCPVLINLKPIHMDDTHIRASYAREYATFIDEIVNKH